MGIKEQTVSSIKWMALFQGLRQFIQFGVAVTLARLLVPHDFGLVTMSGVVIGFVMAGGNLGISQSIIHKKDYDNDHLNSAFWGTFGFGVMMFFLMWIIAPFAADYYEEQILEPIIIVSSFRFLINPIVLTHYALLQKQMRFKELSSISFFTFFIGSGISVIMAFSGFGVWSIVVGHLLTSPVDILLIWKKEPWRPQFKFDWIKFKELFRFGLYISLQDIVNYLSKNYDYIIIGKIIGARALGIYTIAYDLMSKPHTEISPILTKILFPAFSTIQDQNDKIRNGYLKATAVLATVTFPIMGGIFCIADDFIFFAYGEKWIDVVPILKIFCLVGALRSIATMVGSVQNAKGRPDIGLKLNIFILAVFIPTFIIAAKNWGLLGVTWSLLIVTVPIFLISQKITLNLIDLPLRSYLKNLITPVSLTMSMVLLVKFSQQLLAQLSDNIIIDLSVSVCVGVLSYSTLLFIFNKQVFFELRRFVFKREGK